MWRRGRLCARVRACAGAGESLRTYIPPSPLCLSVGPSSSEVTSPSMCVCSSSVPSPSLFSSFLSGLPLVVSASAYPVLPLLHQVWLMPSGFRLSISHRVKTEARRRRKIFWDVIFKVSYVFGEDFAPLSGCARRLHKICYNPAPCSHSL